MTRACDDEKQYSASVDDQATREAVLKPSSGQLNASIYECLLVQSHAFEFYRIAMRKSESMSRSWVILRLGKIKQSQKRQGRCFAA